MSSTRITDAGSHKRPSDTPKESDTPKKPRPNPPVSLFAKPDPGAFKREDKTNYTRLACMTPQSAKIERQRAAILAGPSGSKIPNQPYKGYDKDHFINPSIIQDASLRLESQNGHYKNAWSVANSIPRLKQLPNRVKNDEVIILIFKDDANQLTPEYLYRCMQNTIDQYNEASRIFSINRVVSIYNADTAIEDGYLIVNKIDLSLLDVILKYEKKYEKESIKPIESLDELNKEPILKSIFKQICDFYRLSLECQNDADLNTGNFRLIPALEMGYRVVLTDFREEISGTDFFKAHKVSNLRDMKRDFQRVFAPSLYSEFFPIFKDLELNL